MKQELRGDRRKRNSEHCYGDFARNVGRTELCFFFFSAKLRVWKYR